MSIPPSFRLGALTLAVVALAAPLASQAAVQAHVDRSTVAPSESLTLTLSSDGSSAQPDLAPLAKDFIVQGSGQQNSINLINGNLSRSTRWQIRLQPRHGGSLQIPALQVGGEQTAVLAVNVAEPSKADLAQAAQHVFMEVEAGGAGAHSVILQQQIPYTVRLFHDDSIVSGGLNPLAPDNATVQQLGADRKYTAIRYGRSYEVIERHFAIAPERSGTLEIPPATFQGTMVVAPAPDADEQSAQGNTGPLAEMLRNTPFANDPMFRNAFRGMGGMPPETRPVSAQGTAISFKVEPRPAQATGNWLPAEGISLHDSWQDQPPNFRAGEPVTRTITIQGKGLSGAQIPPLALPTPANARVYADAPTNESRTDGQTIYGLSKQTVTYIPDAIGTLEIPAVKLDWWNTQTHAQAHSELQAMSFQVAPGLPGSSTRQAMNPSPQSGPGTAAATGAKPGLVDQALDAARAWLQGLRWNKKWGTGALLALALAGVITWVLRDAKSEEDDGDAAPGPDDSPDNAQSKPPRKKLSLRTLEQACRANDRHAAAQALLDLARAEWPADPPRGLSALAGRLEAGSAEVAALDRCLYGADEAWHGEPLWRALAGGLHAKVTATHADNNLQALYPTAP